MIKLIGPIIFSSILLTILYLTNPSPFEQAIYGLNNIQDMESMTVENFLVYILLLNFFIITFSQFQIFKIQSHKSNESLLYGGFIVAAMISITILSIYILNFNVSYLINIKPKSYITIVLLTYLITFIPSLYVYQLRSGNKSEPSVELNNKNLLAEKKLLILNLKSAFLKNNLDTYDLDIVGNIFIKNNGDSLEYITALKKINELVVEASIKVPANLLAQLNQYKEI